jgi:beta-glucosidase
VARHLKDVAGRFCTINEPNIVCAFGHEVGIFPPGLRDPEARRRADATMIAAHRAAVPAVKGAAPGVPVGLCVSMNEYQAEPGGEAHMEFERGRMEDQFLRAAHGDDFVGVQTYTRQRFGPDGMLPPPPGARLTQMPYEYWPQALEATIRRAWDVTGGTPVLVTEHGIATDDDQERMAFVTEGLHGVQRCLRDGIPVLGYTYWSLLDNFEWVFGYQMRFGLVDVDRTTQRRLPKPSAAWLGAIARANAFPAA